MKRILFFLFLFGGCQFMQGQQIISLIGGWFENEQINTQWTLGEVCFGAKESSETASFQIIPGTFSPSEGIILPTGNENEPANDLSVRFTVVGNQLHICHTGTETLICRLYSLEGKLLHNVVISSAEYTWVIPSSQSEVFLIQLIGNSYNKTFKFIAP